MSGGWTKGPWQIAEAGGSSTGRCIWRTDGDEANSNWARICSHVNNEADAHLIAAAPELAEALEELLDYSGGADSALDDEYVVERARAALQKARGQ